MNSRKNQNSNTKKAILRELENFIKTIPEIADQLESKSALNSAGLEQLTFESILGELENEQNKQEFKNKKVKEEITLQMLSTTNESFPLNLVNDFDQFISYIESHTVLLTKTKEYISRKHLPAINEQMSVKTHDATLYTEQEYYPLIHFFYYLALSGRILEKAPYKSNQFQLKGTERLNLYKELTDTEKYIFLLETFWVDTNWARLNNKRHNSFSLSLHEVFSLLIEKQPGSTLVISGEEDRKALMLNHITYDWNYFFLYFEWFGLWVCEKNQERIEDYGTKDVYFAKSITLTPFGAKLIPILLISRNLNAWNLPKRREEGELNPLPGSVADSLMIGDLPEKIKIEIYGNAEEDQSSQLFLEPFVSMFPEGELQRTLPRNSKKFEDGIYTFKVSLSKSIWRKVILSAQHTMEDLNNIILRAYQFDEDHLYSFFMDGRKWSDDCIASPHDNGSHPNAARVKIGAVGLQPGQRILYLYDYGDEWCFDVEVEKIEEKSQQIVRPYVREEKGAAPPQYRDY